MYSETINEFQQIKDKYFMKNHEFKKCVIYHVGIDAGFHSEVDAMMECMLYCYLNKIRFVLYADDANFAGKNGWNEFFEDFCEMNHDMLNHQYNLRYEVDKKHILFHFNRLRLKNRNHVQYLTSDIFKKCIDRKYSQTIQVDWPELDIHGTIFDEFGKLGKVALHYNKTTRIEVNQLITSVGLPSEYVSSHFRGGDKTLEFKKLMTVDETLMKIQQWSLNIHDLFVFTDDYRYVRELKEKRPNWNIYTLAGADERGYYNADFNQLSWDKKRKEMIKLFAMIDICLLSSLHLGCEQACVNNYIKSIKKSDAYIPIMEE